MTMPKAAKQRVLEQSILECKFPPRFTYLDVCGKIIQELTKALPEATVEQAALEFTQFRLAKHKIDFKFSTNLISLSCFRFAQEMGPFEDVSDKVIPLVANMLEVDTFARVGNRFLMALPYDGLEDAQAHIDRLGYLTYLSIPNTIKGKPTETRISVRFESEDNGQTIIVSPEGRTLDIYSSHNIEIRDFIRFAVKLDVDFYTKKPVSASALVPRDFLRRNWSDIGKIADRVFGS